MQKGGAGERGGRSGNSWPCGWFVIQCCSCMCKVPGAVSHMVNVKIELEYIVSTDRKWGGCDMLCVCAVESWGGGSKSDVAGSCDARHAGKPHRTPSYASTSPGGAPADSESVMATMVCRGRKVRGGTVTFLFHTHTQTTV